MLDAGHCSNRLFFGSGVTSQTESDQLGPFLDSTVHEAVIDNAYVSSGKHRVLMAHFVTVFELLAAQMGPYLIGVGLIVSGLMGHSLSNVHFDRHAYRVNG